MANGRHSTHSGEVQLPRAASSPLREVGRRVGFAVSLVVFVALIVLLGRDGYVDDTGDQIGVLDSLYYASVTVTTTGYGDITAFVRAFRRWSGTTPGAYRRHHRGQAFGF